MPDDNTLPQKPGWRAEAITDATYRQKFIELPDIIQDWIAAHGGLAGKEILDFGCGEATTAAGIALRYQPQRVVAIDINSEMENCAGFARLQLGLERLPANLMLHSIRPGHLHDPADRFDLIYSWSVFEHVEQRLLPRTFGMLRDALKTGGLLFIQIAPLFYSEDGGHLMNLVPEPWGHLLNQHNVYLEKIAAACADTNTFGALKSMFETLNRLTVRQLIEHARIGGFEVLREYRSLREGEMPPHLADIYQNETLLTEQIVLLLTPRSV